MRKSLALLLQSSLMVLLCTAILPVNALDESDAIGDWLLEGESETVIRISRESDDVIRGRVLAVYPFDRNPLVSVGEPIIRGLRISGDSVEFRILGRPTEWHHERPGFCEDAWLKFTGAFSEDSAVLVGHHEDGRYYARSRDDGSQFCELVIQGAKAIKLIRLPDAPACCDEIDFTCDQAEPELIIPASTPDRETLLAAFPERCRQLETQARYDCNTAEPFYESIEEAYELSLSGQNRQRVVTIFLGPAQIGIIRERTGEGWEYAYTSKQRQLRGDRVWDIGAAQPLSEDDWDVIADIGMIDREFLQFITRLWTPRETRAREYLDYLFDLMRSECRNGHAVGFTEPLFTTLAFQFMAGTELPSVVDDLDDTGDLAKLALDSEQPVGQRLLAGGMLGLTLGGMIFDDLRGLKHAYRDGVKMANDQLQKARRQLEINENLLRRDAAGQAALTPDIRNVLEGRIRELRDDVRRLEEGIKEGQEVIRQIDLYGVRPKLEGHIGGRSTRQLRELVQDNEAVDFDRILASEALGLRATYKYADDAFPTHQIADLGEQIIGPDHGIRVARPGGQLDVLFEAKSRRGSFAIDPDPGEILGLRARSNAKQHTPDDLTVFSDQMLEQSQRRIEGLRRLRDGDVDAALLRDPYLRRIHENVDPAELPGLINTFHQKEKYWTQIRQRLAAGNNNVALHVVIFDPDVMKYRAWKWDFSANPPGWRKVVNNGELPLD